MYLRSRVLSNLSRRTAMVVAVVTLLAFSCCIVIVMVGKTHPTAIGCDDCEYLAGFCIGWLGGSAAPRCKLRQSFLFRERADERSVG